MKPKLTFTPKEKRNSMSLKAIIDFVMENTDLTKDTILSMELDVLIRLRDLIWDTKEKQKKLDDFLTELKREKE